MPQRIALSLIINNTVNTLPRNDAKTKLLGMNKMAIPLFQLAYPSGIVMTDCAAKQQPPVHFYIDHYRGATRLAYFNSR